MKAVDVLSMQSSLEALAATKLPAKAAYKVGKALNQARSMINHIRMSQSAVYKEFGDLSEDKAQYLVPADADRSQAFHEAMGKVLTLEMTAEFHPISLNDLGDVEIEPGHLANLMGHFIVELTCVEPLQQSA